MSTNSYEITETPEVPFDYGLVLKDGLFMKLYIPQIEYWNKRLRDISERNVDAYVRADTAFNQDDKSFVSIFHEGESLNLLPIDDDDPVSPYCLELYLGDESLVKDATVVLHEVRKLSKERYESQRFLAGLAMLDPPPAELENILGDGLARMCQNVFLDFGWDPAALLWETRTPCALETFVTEHKDIITSMQERVLLNLITI